MKKVMLIGDSIRRGYQAYVSEELGDKYEVWGSEDNNRFAKYCLRNLPNMFKECGKPDIIHWNNGLWDMAIVYEEDGPLTPIDLYISDMSKILRELRKVTDKIIFATTTPVKPEKEDQKNEIITEYNNRIVEFMKKENIVINDLNSLVSTDPDKYICDDNMHLSEEGKKVCAKQVAEYIRKISE